MAKAKIYFDIAIVDTYTDYFLEDFSTEKKPSFLYWKKMITRCYGDNPSTHEYYKDKTVCAEWLKFSNFEKWYDENYPGKGILSIDLRNPINKVYGPENCIYVPKTLHYHYPSTKENERGLPTGVHEDGYGGYEARMSVRGVEVSLGTTYTVEDAYELYKAEKRGLFVKNQAFFDEFHKDIVPLMVSMYQ